MAIINKYKDTTGAGSEILAKGELATNTVDGTLYVGDGVANVALVASVVPTGTNGDTLRYDVGAWVADDVLHVASTTVTINGTLLSPGAGSNSFRAGVSAGSTDQGDNSVAVGRSSGQTSQGNNTVAIGNSAGNDTQGGQSIAVGYQAALTDQGTYSVAVGDKAGKTTQGGNAVAVGKTAGQTSQGNNAIAVGNLSGNTGQGGSAVAVGSESGKTDQAANSVALGNSAGKTTQGDNSVAVGKQAGQTNQGDNGIIINSSGTALDDTTAGHIHIASDDGSLDFTSAAGWSMSDDLEVTGTVESDHGISVGATEIAVPTQAAVSSITTVTQLEYDAIVTPDANTLYVIV